MERKSIGSLVKAGIVVGSLFAIANTTSGCKTIQTTPAQEANWAGFSAECAANNPKLSPKQRIGFGALSGFFYAEGDRLGQREAVEAGVNAMSTTPSQPYATPVSAYLAPAQAVPARPLAPAYPVEPVERIRKYPDYPEDFIQLRVKAIDFGRAWINGGWRKVGDKIGEVEIRNIELFSPQFTNVESRVIVECDGKEYQLITR